MAELSAVPDDVLVLGGGFAGIACARRLERRLPRGSRVTLVSNENHFVFQPLLPEVVGANIDPSHVITPIRHLLRRTRVACGEIVAIAPPGASRELASVTVRTQGTGTEVTFTARRLVLALGSVVDVSKIPGMAEHSLPMKNVADALRLRHTILRRLEQAVLEPEAAARRALLTFVVVGGGFSGVETAAEIHDLLRSVRRFFPTLRDEALRVLVVHGRDRILPELHERLSAYALASLQRRGVEFVLQEKTKAVSAQGVWLGSGKLLPARTVVCTIGNAPHPLLLRVCQLQDGRVVTDECLRVPCHDGVYAIGDCARSPDGHGGIAPPTAQFAQRQGTCVADAIVAEISGKRPRPFAHRSQGQLATLGHRNAVAMIGGMRIAGFFAWWLWRTIYLLKLPRLERRLRVVIDWTLNLFFPRDLNALDPAPTKSHDQVHLEAGETLFRQGDPSSAFYVVERGCIELVRCDDDGNMVGRDELGPGAHFGEGSLLRRGVRSTTATALASSEVLVFPAREFLRLAGSFRGLRDLLTTTSRRFQPIDQVLPNWVPAGLLADPVREHMTAPVFTLAATATLRAALHEFLARKVNAFPIVDAQQRLAGVVTNHELFAALRGDRELEAPLTGLLRPAQAVGVDDAMACAIEAMRRHDCQHVVVIDDDRQVVGMLSMKDVLRELLGAAPAVAAR
ncbi:MAG: FAD-dependent oxidoreductase [Planctomycetes bacterium]|nr:FAD-dependent oxidoreductase [Planctomycetota bacterium]